VSAAGKPKAAEIDRQLEVMREGCVEFYGEDELRVRLAERLGAGLPLRVKLGMDPSSPDLHLGHTVVLRKLRRMQEIGHVPIFLIGDFTARIGDPSGRSKTRPALSEAEVHENARTYVDQVATILDVEHGEVRFNSEWMSKLTPADFVKLCSHVTLARLLERDDFSKRFAAETPIFVHEFLYPFVQAYDSVALEADIELGGTDQTFNLLMGRELQRHYGQAPQAVLTHPLLVGTDGSEKMSKSLGNSIGISEPPEQIYGKIMSLPDATMLDYIALLSSGDWGDLDTACAQVAQGAGDPLALKHSLASRVVARQCGADHARAAEEHFRRVVQRRELPEDIPRQSLSLSGATGLALLEVLESLGMVESRSAGRRLVAQGAVRIDGQRIEDPTLQLAQGDYLIKVGKRRFAQLEVLG
jgi:tyrosyl-tRNA synthetase